MRYKNIGRPRNDGIGRPRLWYRDSNDPSTDPTYLTVYLPKYIRKYLYEVSNGDPGRFIFECVGDALQRKGIRDKRFDNQESFDSNITIL